MKKNILRAASGIVSVLVLSGCVQAATNSLRKELQQECEQEGMVFLESEKTVRGAMLRSVTIAGECVGPNDEGYAEAVKQSKAYGGADR